MRPLVVAFAIAAALVAPGAALAHDPECIPAGEWTLAPGYPAGDDWGTDIDGNPATDVVPTDVVWCAEVVKSKPKPHPKPAPKPKAAGRAVVVLSIDPRLGRLGGV
jgi:hypothetical protein